MIVLTLEQLEFLFSISYNTDKFADYFWTMFSRKGGDSLV